MNRRQAKRWLATNDARWLRLRQQLLCQEPICRHCLAEKVTPPNPSTVVDHIDGRSETAHDFRRNNLQGLCKTHHDVKTAIENGSFGRKSGQATRRGCDVNGVPLERSHPWRTNKS